MKLQRSTSRTLDELPFGPLTDTLKSVLRRKYLTRVSKWLQGKQEGRILAEESNSNWEAALTIMFFADAQTIFTENNEEREFCDKISSLCAEVARHLISKKIVISSQYICWDRVTWDTAVVVRALLKTLAFCPDEFSDVDKNEIFDTVSKAMHWLFMRFEKWEAEVKYPFGPADVAQILLTTVFLKRNFPADYQKIFGTYTFENRDIPIEEQICRYLLQVKETKKRTTEDIDENIISWGDFFQTAETIDSLLTYYSTLERSDEKQRILMKEIEMVCKQTFRFFEYEQCEDGMWGTHVDTLRTLYIYVKGPKLLPSLDSEPHLVFKALRWICDEKQCFDDGSFLHTMFLTIFMCEALVAVYNYWPLSERTVGQIYDDVFWSSPVRTTFERTKRFAAEMGKQEVSAKLEITQRKLETEKKTTFTVSITLVTLLAFLFIGISLGLLSIGINNSANTIALASLIGLIYTTILILRLGK